MDVTPENVAVTLQTQSAGIAASLASMGIDTEPDREIVALIAYLQRLGQDGKRALAAAAASQTAAANAAAAPASESRPAAAPASGSRPAAAPPASLPPGAPLPPPTGIGLPGPGGE